MKIEVIRQDLLVDKLAFFFLQRSLLFNSSFTVRNFVKNLLWTLQIRSSIQGREIVRKRKAYHFSSFYQFLTKAELYIIHLKQTGMRADSKPNRCMVICIYICIGGSMLCLPAFKLKRMSLFLQHTLLLNEPSLVRKTLVLWYIMSVKIGRKIFQGLLLTADLAKTNIWRAFFSANKAH